MLAKMSNVRDAIQIISTFLSVSVDTDSGLPLIQRLHNGISALWTPPLTSPSQQTEVILYALDLLRTIHIAVEAENGQLGIKDWRHVNALVDVIVVLGLYKALSSGVGLPENRKVKSILLANEGQRDELPPNDRKVILETFVSIFKTIIEEGGDVGENFQRRFNVDIISAMADLAFNPLYPESDQSKWKEQYNSFLAG